MAKRSGSNETQGQDVCRGMEGRTWSGEHGRHSAQRFDIRDHGPVRENASTKVDFELTKAPPYAPCVPYVTATGRITVPFPGDAVDTRHARFLERSERIPAKQPGKDSKPQLYIYSNTAQEISLAYSGVGQDTTRRAFVA